MTDPTDALAAALHAIGGFADDFPRPTAAEREDAVDLLAALAASGWTLAPVETEQANLAGFREGLAHAKATYGPGHRAAAIAEVRREVTALRIEPDDYRAAWQHNQTLDEVQAMLDRLDNLAQPAPDPLRAAWLYSGQHDDCIATIAHYHAEPYKLGQWSAAPDPLRCRHCPNTSHTTEWHEAHYSYPTDCKHPDIEMLPRGGAICHACGLREPATLVQPAPDPWTVDCGIPSCPFRGVPHVGHAETVSSGNGIDDPAAQPAPDPLPMDPHTSCPFCGAPGRYVTADEGTSYFAPDAQPAPDPLGPDDHGHTGRLWCDPCVGHGVMLEQGVHRCAPTPDPRLAALVEAAQAVVGEVDQDADYCFGCHDPRPCAHDALRDLIEGERA
jgi:hypothetical protein